MWELLHFLRRVAVDLLQLRHLWTFRADAVSAFQEDALAQTILSHGVGSDENVFLILFKILLRKANEAKSLWRELEHSVTVQLRSL